MLKLSIFVFLGSVLGGVCRFLASAYIGRIAGGAGMFPYGTFAVNIVGCFLIGLIYAAVDRGVPMSPETKTFLTAGFCGGLTTFSTFSHENYLLFHAQGLPTVALYTVLSLAIGFTAAWFGHAIMR